MKIVVCDDSANDRKKYSDLFIALAEKHNIIADLKIYESGDSLLYSFKESSSFADIIFFNIDISGISGIDVTKKLREMGYKNEIIFLADSKKYILQGYDVSAFNYIIKTETSDSDFEKVFLDVIRYIKDKEQKICLFNNGVLHKNIPISDIKYFYVKKKISTVHFQNGTFEFPCTIDKLEREFEAYGFVSIKRDYLISIKYILNIKSDSVTLTDGKKILINKKGYKKLKKLMKYFSGSMAIE